MTILVVLIEIELAFDPDQDLEKKRTLRQNYRKLASKIEGRRS